MVHEKGIQVGRRQHRWAELSRVTYWHEASEADQSTYHNWDFERKDGKTDHLTVCDDGVGFYIDIPELEEYLEEALENCENLHAPRITTDLEDPFLAPGLALPDRSDVVTRLEKRTAWRDIFELMV